MRRFTCLAASTAIIASLLVSIPSAGAQSQSPSPPGFSQSSPNIPDNKLDAAAAAMLRIASLQQDYHNQMAAAPSGDRKRIATEASDALTKAVTDQGLSVDEYAEIVDAAQNDAGVREKILQRIRPQRGEEDEGDH
jgi:hypothetical protein